MAGWKFHLAQLTKSFPTDFNYLGPRWNGLLLRVGVNATKYRKPWPRTDIIVPWPHDCLSPIMRWLQLKPGQTVSGMVLKYSEKKHWKLQIECNLTFDRDFLFNFPNWYFVLGVCKEEPKRADLIDKPGLSGRQPARQLRKIIQLNASLLTNWAAGKNELWKKGGLAGSLRQKWS